MFSTPFAYVASLGSTLVIDLVQTAVVTSTPYWAPELWNDIPVSSYPNLLPQPGCLFADGSGPDENDGYPATLGKWWRARYRVTPALLARPLRRSRLQVGDRPAVWLPLIDASAGSSSFAISAPIQTPNDLGLLGQSFYDQSVFLDPAANALGIVTTSSNEWLFGTNRAPGCELVYATGPGAATLANGSLRPLGVTLRLY